MRARESYPPGVPCWLDTAQPDPEAAKSFYGELFGWQFENQAPEGAPGPYYVAKINGLDVAAILGPTPSGGPAPTWNTYTAVESVDRTVARVKQAGGQVIDQPTDIPGAGRTARCADTEGAAFSVWEADKFIGAQLVNDHGAWNFSELNTRDREAATRFYSAVFDWNVIDVGVGTSSFSFFTLPGYGDFLAKSDPDIYDRHEANGVSEGFSDAVAWLMPLGPEAGDTKPHWSVTFAVEDADAAAATAENLGGTVLVPPFDVEPVRMTVIADPQGAIFTASKYQPNA